MSVTIKEASYVIIHVPDFVRYGSKPIRDIEENPALVREIDSHLRGYQDVVNYAPHQVFIGNKHPDELYDVPKPWYEHLLKNGKRNGIFGEIMPEEEFYGWMKVADDFDLLWLDPQFIEQIKGKFASHPFVSEAWVKKLGQGKAPANIKEIIEQGAALPVHFKGKLVGSLRRDHDKDDTLKAEVLMENLVAKASGALAMLHLFKLANILPRDVDFVLDCTETAVGDRYNRGGGSLSKAYAEMVGCVNATGNDIRAFCCAPNHALVMAAGLVESGIYNNVIVSGGGCLAKVGMKSAAHYKHNMPILEDVVAAISFLVTKDDGVSPMMRLDSIGKHDVGAGSAQQAIMTSLILKPLNRLGMKMTEIDKYSTELHNPEITLPSGSGDTPATNYKIMASLAALSKQIDKTELDKFVREKGMPGYCPTQGHVPSAVPFLGHAIKAMKEGKMKRAMFVAKGSLFLGRMSQLSDGISFILEANSKSEK
jgi:betaine reductase